MKRRGTSLIELLCVIAVSGVVLGLVASLLATMMQVESQAASEGKQLAHTSRLSLQFRADAHSASEAVVASEDRLTLVLAGEEAIDYVAQAGGIERVKRQGQTVTHHDQFRIADLREGRLAEVRFQPPPSQGGPPIAAIDISFRMEAAPSKLGPNRTLRIEAEVGRDARWSRPASGDGPVPPAPEGGG